MKKGVLVFILFSLVALCCSCFLIPSMQYVTNALNVSYLDVVDVNVLEDPYQTIMLGDIVNKHTILDKIRQDQESRGEIMASTGESLIAEVEEDYELTEEELMALCEENDYFLMSTETGYEIYYKYQLKTLIVETSVKDNFGAKEVKDWQNGHKMLKFDTEEATEYAYTQISKQTSNVMLDRIITAAEINNFNNGTFNTWGAEYMDMDSYRDYYAVNGVDVDVAVAVFDTGINTVHEIFEGRLIKENGRVQGYCASGITTQYVYSGYSFEDDHHKRKLDDGTFVDADGGHGTHVSGIICDLTPSNVKILPVKVLNYYGSGSVVGQIDSLYEVIVNFAEKYNVVAINMSLGGNYPSTTTANYANSLYSVFFNKLKEYQITPVVAAGNEGNSVSFVAPGGCEDAIVVSALQKSGSTCTVASYSNYGSSIDIAAPGSSIKSAIIGRSPSTPLTTGTRLASGTSMACPHVAAAVALLCLDARYYDEGMAIYTPDIIEQRLYEMAVDLGTKGKDAYYGYGMLNFKKISGDIEFEVEDKVTTYNGMHQNIEVVVKGVTNYQIFYGFSSGKCDISDITLFNEFKNYTNGVKVVYFKIKAVGYQDTIGAANLIINRASVGIIVANQESVYGNEILLNQNAYSVSGTIYGDDDLNISLSTTAKNGDGVGNYPITATSWHTNYNITIQSGVYKIKPKPITISSLGQTSVYGDIVSLDQSRYVIDGELEDGDKINVQLETDATNTSNVGFYDINMAVYGSISNYAITKNVGKIEITKRPISVSAKNQTIVYGEEIDLGTEEYLIGGGIVNNDNISVQLSTIATNASPVGDYDIVVSCGGDAENYLITKYIGKLKITQRTVGIKILDQSCVFGQEVVLKSLFEIDSQSQIVNGDDLGVRLSTTASDNSEIGLYPIILTDWSNKNYIVVAENGWFEIVSPDVVVTILPQTFVYGEEIILDQLCFDVNSSIDKSLLGIVLYTTAVKGCDVGSNYEIFGESTSQEYAVLIKKGVLTIVQKEVEITLQNQETIYGDVNLNQNMYIADEDVDDLGIVLSCDATIKSNANSSYLIQFDWTNKNYNVISNTNAYMIIQPRDILIKTYQTAVYGDNVNIDHYNYSVEMGNIVNGDDLGVTFSTDAYKLKPVGVYEIIFNYSNKNYNVELSSDSVFKIVKRNIVVSTEQYKYYGDDVKLNSSYKIVQGKVVNNDMLDISFVTNATIESPVGEYEISIDSNNPNYIITLVESKMRVLKRVVFIESVKYVEYGDNIELNNDFIIVSGSIAFSGDFLNISFSTNATKLSPVGKYELHLNYENNNYDIILTTSSHLEILPRKITVKINNQSGVYGEDVVLKNNVYEVVNGTVVNGDNLNILLSTIAGRDSYVGDYEIVGVSKNGNYEALFISGIYTIEKRTLTIKVLDQEISRALSFDIDQMAYEIIDGEVCGDDELDVKILSDAGTFSMMGKYDLMAYIGNENYDVEVVGGELVLGFAVIDGVVIFGAMIVILTLTLIITKKIMKARKNKKMLTQWMDS